MGKIKLSRANILDFHTFGEFCRVCRKHYRMSQTEVGKLLGYSGNHISDFERGAVDSLYLAYAYSCLFGATFYNYVRWCDKLDIDIDTKDLRGVLVTDYSHQYDAGPHSVVGMVSSKELRTLIAIQKYKEVTDEPSEDMYVDDDLDYGEIYKEQLSNAAGGDINKISPIGEDDYRKCKENLGSPYGMGMGDNIGLSTTDKPAE